MNWLQLAGTWYVVIGLVWAYLLIHEYVTNGSFKRNYGNNTEGGFVFVVSMFVLGAVTWPYSVWKHYRTGKIRDLFV